VGYATTGGPWITPERRMQQLVRKMQAVQGGKQVTIDLPLPGSNPVDLGVFAVPAEGVIPLDKTIDLSARMDAKGHLVWDAPPGAWNVYRIGYAFSGRQPSPACLPTAVAMLSCIPAASTAGLARPRCEYLGNPLGIDVPKPRLSWMIPDHKSEI